MHKHLLSFAALIGAVAMAAAPAHANAQQAVPAAAEQTQNAGQTKPDKKHGVAPGESLSLIAEAHQLESWRPLWDANPGLAHPDQINPGQELVVPGNPVPERPLPPGYNQPVQVKSAPARTYAPAQGQQSYAPAGGANYAPGTGGLFAGIRQKESGGNYAINTGNGYYGAYQFDLGTWRSVGGSGYPHQASPAEQDMRAQMLYARRGCQPWPNTCG